MRAWIGKSVIAVGVIHLLFGLVFMHSVLAVLWSEGLFNTVNGEPPREMVFWFFVAGFLLLIVGGLVDRLETSGLGLPKFLSWSFLALVIVGIIVMPISGIWLLVPPLIGMFRRPGAPTSSTTIANSP